MDLFGDWRLETWNPIKVLYSVLNTKGLLRWTVWELTWLSTPCQTPWCVLGWCRSYDLFEGLEKGDFDKQVLVLEVLGFWELIISQSLWESNLVKFQKVSPAPYVELWRDLFVAHLNTEQSNWVGNVADRPHEKKGWRLTFKSIWQRRSPMSGTRKDLKNERCLECLWRSQRCRRREFCSTEWEEVGKSWLMLTVILQPCLSQWKTWITTAMSTSWGVLMNPVPFWLHLVCIYPSPSPQNSQNFITLKN